MGDQATGDLEPAEQRLRRIGKDLRGKVRRDVDRQIGRIRQHQIDGAAVSRGQRLEQIAGPDVDREPKPLCVLTGEGYGIFGDVRRHDPRAGMFVGDRERHRAGPGAEIHHAGHPGAPEELEPDLHQDLGLGPGDEHPGPHREREAAEPLFTR